MWLVVDLDNPEVKGVIIRNGVRLLLVLVLKFDSRG